MPDFAPEVLEQLERRDPETIREVLILAAGYGDDETIRYLSRLGVNPDVADDDGDSAVFCAASMGYSSTVELLLSLGAKADPPPGPNGSPLTFAARWASPLNGGRSSAPRSEYTRIVISLICAGADPGPMYHEQLVLGRVSRSGALVLASLGEIRGVLRMFGGAGVRNSGFEVMWVEPEMLRQLNLLQESCARLRDELFE